MFGVSGILSLIVGKKAIKAKMRVAAVANLASRATYWKNIIMLMKPTINKGMKMSIREDPGYLYSGILK